MKSLYEQIEGTYYLSADGMYYPNLEPPEEKAPQYGKCGKMRHTYLESILHYAASQRQSGGPSE